MVKKICLQGAGASVNHLHWQFWSTSEVGGELPVETAVRTLLRVYYSDTGPADSLLKLYDLQIPQHSSPGLSSTLEDRNDTKLHAKAAGEDGQVRQWSPVRGLLFHNAKSDPIAMTAAVGQCLTYLLEADIAHNLLITAAGNSVYILPRQPSPNLLWNIRAGFPEAAGEIFFTQPDRAAFASASADMLAKHWRSELNLDTDTWEKFKATCVPDTMSRGWHNPNL